MGVYVTVAELARGLPADWAEQLTDDLGAGAADTDLLEGAIADAEAEVDAHVGRVLPLPLSTVPRFLGLLALDIAVYRVFGRRQIADEAVDARYKAAVRSLEKLARGEVSLGLSAAAPESVAGAQTVAPGSSRVFTRETLRGM